jgi:hypothetical protein
MDYKNKYLKYKQKYVNLKKELYDEQIGGEKPLVNILKNINLFDDTMEKSLNPLHGFILLNTNVIDNYYKFYVPGDDFFKEFITSLYHEVDTSLRPTKTLLDNSSVSVKDFGILLGFLYVAKTVDINSLVETKLKLLKEEKGKLQTEIEKINTHIKRTKYTEEQKINPNLCVEKLKVQLKETESNITTVKNFYSVINYKFKKPFFNKLIKREIKDVYLHVLLSVMWWKSNDKTLIKEYYLGINHIFSYLNRILNLNLEIINIPVDFETDNYTRSELKNYKADNFNQALAVSFVINNGDLKIFSDDITVYFDNSFSDCGETALRNFFNILLFDEVSGSFNLEILKLLYPIDILTEYYETFNNIELQSSTASVHIFDNELNARDAWTYLVSYISNVDYVKETCEIRSGLNLDGTKLNILEVIGYLLEYIETFEDIVYVLKTVDNNIKITEDVDDDGFGTIELTNRNGIYQFQIKQGHYDIVKKEGRIETAFTNLTYEQEKITQIIQNKIPLIKEYFMNIKYTNDLLRVICLENEIIPDDYYFSVLDFAIKKINININLNNPFLRSKDLSKFGVKYNLGGNFCYENIIEMKNSYTIDYSEIKNLEKLEYSGNSNFQNLPSTLKELTLINYMGFLGHANCDDPDCIKNLPNSLTHLIIESGYYSNVDLLPSSLIHLNLGNVFNKKIEHLPPGLQFLTVGSSFNQSIDKLPQSLRSLTLGYSFNKTLYNLPPLLESLTLGYSFTYSIDDLPRYLKHLTLGYSFNCPIDNLPPNLKHVTFGYNYNHSIDILPETVTHLTLDKLFDYDINKFPSSLTHLTLNKSRGRIKCVCPTLNYLKITGTHYTKLAEYFPNLKEIDFRIIDNGRELFNNLPISVSIINVRFNYYDYSTGINTKYDLKNFIPKEVDHFEDHFEDHLEDTEMDIKKYFTISLTPNIKKIRTENIENLKFFKNIPPGCVITNFDDVLLE